MMKLYHGTTIEVSQPIVTLGRENLDFGKGFYLTNLRKQAEEWARRIGRRRMEIPVLNVYLLDLDEAKLRYRYLGFESYNRDWLDFIAGNRLGKKFWRDYDIIEGGIADDRVIDTVESYIAGLMDANIALKRLAEHKPNNQICILNQKLIDELLVFEESKKL